MAIGNLTVDVRASRRPWLYPMLVAGWFAVRLGANADKVAGWVVNYGIKIEVSPWPPKPI